MIHQGKIALKIYPIVFQALYWRLVNYKQVISNKLNTRHGIVTTEELALYQLAVKYNSSHFETWKNRNPTRLYSLQIELVSAFALAADNFNVKYGEDPYFFSLIGMVHMRLSDYISPESIKTIQKNEILSV